MWLSSNFWSITCLSNIRKSITCFFSQELQVLYYSSDTLFTISCLHISKYILALQTLLMDDAVDSGRKVPKALFADHPV